MDRQEILDKIQELRVKWKKTPLEDTSGRKVIEKRAKLLRFALYKLEHKKGWF